MNTKYRNHTQDELIAVVMGLEAELERRNNLLDKIKREAQCHAMEARAQRSTVQEVIQAGKPGMGDWEDVPGMVADLKARLEAVRERAQVEVSQQPDYTKLEPVDWESVL